MLVLNLRSSKDPTGYQKPQSGSKSLMWGYSRAHDIVLLFNQSVNPFQQVKIIFFVHAQIVFPVPGISCNSLIKLTWDNSCFLSSHGFTHTLRERLFFSSSSVNLNNYSRRERLYGCCLTLHLTQWHKFSLRIE